MITATIKVYDKNGNMHPLKREFFRVHKEDGQQITDLLKKVATAYSEELEVALPRQIGNSFIISNGDDTIVVSLSTDPFTTVTWKDFTPGSNVMQDDMFHMGQGLGRSANGNDRIVLLTANHPSEKCNYFIVANEQTGKRMKVFINELE